MKRVILVISLLVILLGGCEQNNTTDEFTVSFESNGASLMDDVVVEKGETVTEPTKPEKAGHTFVGWFSDETLNIAYNFTKPVDANMKLYAKWNIETYDVTFIMNDEISDSDTTFTYEYGEEVQEYEPIREGWIFDGWYLDDALTTLYSYGPIGEGNITLYAKWSMIEITLSLDYYLDGETNPDSITLNYGEVYTLPVPEIDGYVFTGWFTYGFAEAPVTSYTAGVEDKTLYALFKVAPKQTNIAVIIGPAGVENPWYSQAIESTTDFADENDLNARYFQSPDYDYDSIFDTVVIAVEDGAEIVVFPTWQYQFVAWELQFYFPDVHFVLIDSQPISSDMQNDTIENNTMSIYFAEQEAGFLAGYATVMDGFTSLGFIGGMSIPTIKEFGIGYISGAYYAANQLSISIEFDSDDFIYTESFIPDANIKALAASFYARGVEVIFGAANKANSSIIAAAEEENGYMINADIDSSASSASVLSSACKGIYTSIYLALEMYYTDNFIGGEILTFGVQELAVYLPMDTSRFEQFSSLDYEVIYSLLQDGTIIVPDNYSSMQSFLIELDPSYETLFSEDSLK